MWSKQRIMELALSCAEDTMDACQREIGTRCIGTGTTEECRACIAKNTKAHAEAIIRQKEYRCYEQCDHVRKILGLSIEHDDCSGCHEKILEYIETDFKKIFNDLK